MFGKEHVRGIFKRNILNIFIFDVNILDIFNRPSTSIHRPTVFN